MGVWAYATKWRNRTAHGFSPGYGGYRERALKGRPNEKRVCHGVAKSQILSKCGDMTYALSSNSSVTPFRVIFWGAVTQG
jgi:hypothetical protein